MATYRRHGAGWQAQIIRKGYPARYRTFDTKEAAQKWAVQIEADMTKGVYKDPTTALNTTLGDALDRYQREISVRKKGARQEASRIRAWKKSELANKSLARLETADFEAHVDRRRAQGKAENTIRQEIAIVSNLFKKARKKWRMSGLENPMKELEWPGGSSQRSRRISADEIDALIEAYPHGEFGEVLELLCETAMRRSELLSIDWSQVDLPTRVIHLPKTKNGRARDVPLSKRAVELLASRPSRAGQVFTIKPDSMTQAFGRARKRGRADYARRCLSEGKTPDPKFLVNVRLHDGRHEGTSRLSEKGFNVIEIASVSGHEDTRLPFISLTGNRRWSGSSASNAAIHARSVAAGVLARFRSVMFHPIQPYLRRRWLASTRRIAPGRSDTNFIGDSQFRDPALAAVGCV